MSLNETPEIIIWPETHYIFIEKIGPFQETAFPAWRAVGQLLGDLSKSYTVTGRMSLYKVEPNKMTYRAGVIVNAEPKILPVGFQYFKFKGGRYSRFTYTGSYMQLPKVSGRVFEIVEQTKLQKRADFNIENYPNDPTTTPEEQLITEILIPTV